ncbi:hypothetical protein V8B97DRAFT_1876766 [Scleroderma yunnanense]
MRLINVQAFIERERKMHSGWPVNRRMKVLEFRDDHDTDYAILSHRWVDPEVDYDEMVELAKMETEERDDIRRRVGYRKILNSCEQAKRDGYEWLWVDTCCIAKQSSSELSEAINSMYRWYENSGICYAYFHDVPGSSFPTASDKRRYPNSRGWPEWFSRGWTLQEMIAPRNVQFFNKDWHPIGDKRTLARTLSHIARVPEHILRGGFSSNRPCVAQIMSWASNRTTTRVEDRAYSLLGLLDVNMPMLYGEGKKAFHRLQLEIIRISNDQSIFAWGFDRKDGRTGSILADDPSFFEHCSTLELIDHNRFIQDLEHHVPAEELPSTEDRFGIFPITNRGIQIWMFLRPLKGSDSVFEAWLPCCITDPFKEPVRITLALWKSNYYRYCTSPWEELPTEGTLQFCQIYLRYQDTPHHDVTFEIDDSAVTRNGFTYCDTYPSELTGNRLTLTGTDPLCVKVYSHSEADCRFAVGFGQCFGQDWMHVIYEKPISEYSWWKYAIEERRKMLVRGPEHAQSMAELRSRGGRYGRVWIKHTCLPGSTWIVRTSCIVWKSSRKCGVMVDVFQYPFIGLDKWIDFKAEGINDPNCDMRGLMVPYSSINESQDSCRLRVDGVSTEFSPAPHGIKEFHRDGGYFTFSEFHREGNIFVDFGKFLTSDSDITPMRHKIDGWYNTDRDYVDTQGANHYTLYKPLGLSLPSNYDVNSLLASLSTRLTNKYLVTMVIQCANMSSAPPPDPPTPLCTFSIPFVWRLFAGGTVSRRVERSDDE